MSPDVALFAESVRDAIGDWQPPREPELGVWQDDRDDELAARLTAVGWTELWAGGELLGPTVAGGIELGRAAAPVSLIDEATLGAPLWVEGRARHARETASLAVPRRGGGLALGPPATEARPEPTLDGSGTVLVETSALGELESVAATACWRAWNAATLAYFAGLASRSLELAIEHARTREQFGAPLATLPAVQSRLADAALATDAMTLHLMGCGDERRRPSGCRASVGRRGVLRRDRERTPDLRRGRLRARVRAARLPPPSALGERVGRRRVRRAPLSL